MDNSLQRDAGRVCELIQTRRRPGERTIVGIAGPPASGKSTLAETVVEKLNESLSGPTAEAVLLPMDGYHLDNQILKLRGKLAQKGSPETFDSHGFCRAIRGLAHATEESYHPRFDRQMDLAIASAIAIPPELPIVVVEGNYLLLNREPWSSLEEVFSATILVCPNFDTLQERLYQRWINHGLDSAAARARTTANDLPNGRMVIEQSRAADIQLDQS